MSFANMQIDVNVSFQLYPNAVLGTSFNNVKIISIMAYEDARVIRDVESLHSAIYPALPVNSPRRAKDYSYFKIRTQNGDVMVIGRPWIVESSIEVQATKTAQITILNVHPDRRQDLINLLSAGGFTTADIEFV